MPGEKNFVAQLETGNRKRQPSLQRRLPLAHCTLRVCTKSHFTLTTMKKFGLIKSLLSRSCIPIFMYPIYNIFYVYVQVIASLSKFSLNIHPSILWFKVLSISISIPIPIPRAKRSHRAGQIMKCLLHTSTTSEGKQVEKWITHVNVSECWKNAHLLICQSVHLFVYRLTYQRN